MLYRRSNNLALAPLSWHGGALLSPEEAQKTEKNPAFVPELVAKWFAVPMDHDDRQLAKEVRAVGKMQENPVRSIKGFTILTTTDCNARCFYCYEKVTGHR